MGYTKQIFEDGQVLKAEHLNHIEDGVKFLYDNVPYVEQNFLVDETDAVEGTDPTYGKCWGITKAPYLTVGNTYTVVYNGVPYDCVCNSGVTVGLSEGTFILGNFAVVGGANTGEPFAMLIIPTSQIMCLDLSGATSVRFGIKGRENVLNVFVDGSDESNITADKTAEEIWAAAMAGKEVYLYMWIFICRLITYYPGQCAVFSYPGLDSSNGDVFRISDLRGIIVTQDGSVKTS